jgi:hypothetical protein
MGMAGEGIAAARGRNRSAAPRIRAAIAAEGEILELGHGEKSPPLGIALIG